MLSFEWDELKNQRNIKRHGLAFVDMQDFLDDPYLVERLDLREDYGEERIIAYAMVRSRMSNACSASTKAAVPPRR